MPARRPHAASTKVDAVRSFQELRRLLQSHGATEYATGLAAGRETVVFTRENITYRISIPVATCLSDVHEAVRKAYRARVHGPDIVEHENNRRVRALLTVIKAQLIAIDEGVTTFEQMFVGAAVTDNGQTVAERMTPELRKASMEGRIPRALPGFGGTA